MQNENSTRPKHQDKVVALDNLSLGISIVAAVMNVYKAYKRAQKEFEGMENDPRYAYRAKHGDKSFDNKDDDED